MNARDEQHLFALSIDDVEKLLEWLDVAGGCGGILPSDADLIAKLERARDRWTETARGD